MKISLSLADSIIDRITTIYHKQVLPPLVQVTEFDNPQYLIDRGFDTWIDYFARKERLLQIKYELTYNRSRAIAKYGLNQLHNQLAHAGELIELFERLLDYPVAKHKNEILGTLTKLSKNTEPVHVATSVFDQDTKLDFERQHQLLLLDQQNLHEQIALVYAKVRVDVSEESATTLCEEHLIS